jgi:hypothetical protein
MDGRCFVLTHPIVMTVLSLTRVEWEGDLKTSGATENLRGRLRQK